MKNFEQNLLSGFSAITSMGKLFTGIEPGMEKELLEVQKNVLNNDIKSEIEWQLKTK